MDIDNENREIAIKISGVKKRYRLGQIGGGTLQADLQSWWARVRGKEDPNTKIGEEQRSNGTTFMALNGVDFTIYKGEALGIIGRNGAGKSTLLKLLSRVTAPTEGEIDIYGRIASMLEVGTGFNTEMTGRENVYLNGAILGMSKAEIDAKMEQIIEFSEVREFIDTPVKRYSSGMFVKLAFSVAAHLDSEIMIMDEVLAVGDMAFQKKCLDKMRDAAKREGRTVLYVSHNMNTIRQLCDRCVVLDKGKVIYTGDVESSINVYMGNDDRMRSSYDYSNIGKASLRSGRLVFTGIDIKNCPDNKIVLGNNMDFVLHCESHTNIKEVKFRLEISFQDGTMVGTTFTDKPFSIVDGQKYDILMSMPVKNFAPGLYRAVALAYEYNETGSELPIERIESAIIFEVVDNSENSLWWRHEYWGHTKFDDLIIKNVSIKNS